MNKAITLNDIKATLIMEVICGKELLNREIDTGYSGDLLSDVMANAPKGGLWITRQTHVNIVAVAVLRMLSGVIIVNNRKPGEDTIEKAKKQNIPILVTPLPAFEIVGRLYQLGIKGIHQ